MLIRVNKAVLQGGPRCSPLALLCCSAPPGMRRPSMPNTAPTLMHSWNQDLRIFCCRVEAGVKIKAKGSSDFSWSSPGLATPEDDAAPR
jgi:hypothetical protein